MISLSLSPPDVNPKGMPFSDFLKAHAIMLCAPLLFGFRKSEVSILLEFYSGGKQRFTITKMATKRSQCAMLNGQ